ncbi:hypothetical protein VTK26DRAFT_9364 [Humicola hyalothermophila]
MQLPVCQHPATHSRQNSSSLPHWPIRVAFCRSWVRIATRPHCRLEIRPGGEPSSCTVYGWDSVWRGHLKQSSSLLEPHCFSQILRARRESAAGRPDNKEMSSLPWPIVDTIGVFRNDKAISRHFHLCFSSFATRCQDWVSLPRFLSFLALSRTYSCTRSRDVS